MGFYVCWIFFNGGEMMVVLGWRGGCGVGVGGECCCFGWGGVGEVECQGAGGWEREMEVLGLVS